jgi:hypothetical protein
MPNVKFIEEYGLYHKFKIDLPSFISTLPKPPSIHMLCHECDSEQTFNANDYRYVGASVYSLVYICTGCHRFQRIFLIDMNQTGSFVMKVGQFPQWLPKINKNLAKLLHDHLDNYTKGLSCEQEGYGIGAFAYYRRITEEIIDELLDSLADLFNDEEKKKYNEALREAKKEHIAEKKIEIVKDLLPASLRPNNINPLSILYSNLSMGLHNKPEEECLEMAITVREALIFLVDQVIRHKEDSKQFASAIKKLDERNAKRKM